MKFSGLSRLVAAILGVGTSTSAQSPPCETGLYTVLFSGVYLLRGHGCYFIFSLLGKQ